MDTSQGAAPSVVADRSITAEHTDTQRIRIEQHSAVGLLWFAGWLFSIGFLQLSFWKGVLGLVVWPYYVGAALTQLLP